MKFTAQEILVEIKITEARITKLKKHLDLLKSLCVNCAAKKNLLDCHKCEVRT